VHYNERRERCVFDKQVLCDEKRPVMNVDLKKDVLRIVRRRDVAIYITSIGLIGLIYV